MDEKVIESSSIPVQTEIASNNNPKNNLLKYILLVIIGLIILAGAVYAGMQIQNKQTQVVLPPIPTPELGPTSIPDETANWKIYSDKERNFSIKYPLDWNLEMDFLSSNNDVQCSFGSTSFISNSPNAKIVNQSIIKDGKLKISMVDYEYLMPSLYSVGPNGEQYKGDPETTKYTKTEFIFEESPNKPIYLLCDSPIKENYKNKLDQIISTFKFIETTDETVEWKTYKNDFYNFSFNYPEKIAFEEINKTDEIRITLRENEKFFLEVVVVKVKFPGEINEGSKPPYLYIKEPMNIGGKAWKAFDLFREEKFTTRERKIEKYGTLAQLIYNNMFYQIKIYGELSDLQRQILSTFKFLD